MINIVVPFYANPGLHKHVNFSSPSRLQHLSLHEQIKEECLGGRKSG